MALELNQESQVHNVVIKLYPVLQYLISTYPTIISNFITNNHLPKALHRESLVHWTLPMLQYPTSTYPTIISIKSL